VLSFDSFYHKYASVTASVDPNVNLDDFDFDHPSSIDFDNAYQCLLALRKLKPAHAPVYSFATNSRIEGEFEPIEPKRFVIVEGIFAFYDEVRHHNPSGCGVSWTSASSSTATRTSRSRDESSATSKSAAEKPCRCSSGTTSSCGKTSTTTSSPT